MQHIHWFITILLIAGTHHLSGMEAASIEELPLLEVTSITYCALCNEEVVEDEAPTLDCGHIYHTTCSADKECAACSEDEYISYHRTLSLQSIQQEELPQRRKRPEWCKSVFGHTKGLVAGSILLIALNALIIGTVIAFVVSSK